MSNSLVIIGGGVMGLMTALFASQFSSRITILERDEIGHPLAASSGKTRSIRNDYLDPFYARLAYEARTLWEELDRRAADPLLITCGCLNLAKGSITPDLDDTYALKAHQNLETLGFPVKRFDKSALKDAFPHFDADLGCLDVEAGMMNLPAVRTFCLEQLRKRDVTIVEKVAVTAVGPGRVETSAGPFEADAVVITAGMWTREVLQLLPEPVALHVTLQTPDWRYFKPPAGQEALYTAPNMPVFAYLDVGIYGHPIVPGLTPGVKVGFYHPPDLRAQKASLPISCPEDFIRLCMPGFTDITPVEADFTEGCSYDLVSDDNFVIGPVAERVYVGAGWRGTGYKFAPLIGKILSQLALQEGTVYDIQQFSPRRFG